MRSELLMIAALTLPVALAAQAEPPQQKLMAASIVTSATGEARVVPDKATVFLGVETERPTASAAASENAKTQQAVIDTIKKLGVPDEQIRTSDFSVYPRRTTSPDGRTSRVTSYAVQNVVQVKLNDMTKIGAIIDAALAKGANKVNSLQFESSVEDSVRRAALAMAVANARKDADAIASAAGRCIQDLYELSTTEPSRPFVMAGGFAAAREAVAPTPIEPGEQTVSVVVTGRWLLRPASESCNQ
jgi:uncharacterized protein YggE